MPCSQDDASAAASSAATATKSSPSKAAAAATGAPADAGWMKKLFGSDQPDPNANLQPGFVPIKSDFNVPCDGRPATVRHSRKTGRSIR